MAQKADGGKELYLVETEFLFGVSPKDRRHRQVTEILQLIKMKKLGDFWACSSAFLEMGLVLKSRGFPAAEIEETLFLVKEKLIESNVLEAWLSSDDIIRLHELLRRFDVEYFDAMHAATALGRNATLVTDDKVYKTLGVKTISFDDLIAKIKQ